MRVALLGFPLAMTDVTDVRTHSIMVDLCVTEQNFVLGLAGFVVDEVFQCGIASVSRTTDGEEGGRVDANS